MKKRDVIYRLSNLILMGIYIAVLQRFHLAWYAVILGAIPSVIFNIIWKLYIENR